jgi:hypothetical protein
MVTVCACNSIAWRIRSAEDLHFLDRALDRAVGVDRLARRLLDGADLVGDVVGGPGGLAGEALHLLGHDREAAAGIAGARRLDGCVEREQVGLARNVADQAEDRFDRLDVARQRLADLHRLLGLVASLGGDARGDLDLANAHPRWRGSAPRRSGRRPLSPHLSIWRWGPHMLVSILHRVTGGALTVAGWPCWCGG